MALKKVEKWFAVNEFTYNTHHFFRGQEIKGLTQEEMTGLNDLIYKKDNKMNKIIDVGFGITAMNRQYILLMVSKDNFFMIYDSKTIQENVFLKAKNPLTKIF